DFFRVRRPGKHRSIAVSPAGVIGCITEILRAIRRELRFLTAGQITNPQVVIANESRALFVGRQNVRWRSTASPKCGGLTTLLRRGVCRALIGDDVALPTTTLGRERNRFSVARQVEISERQPVSIEGGAGGGRKCGRQLCLIEDRRFGSRRGVD